MAELNWNLLQVPDIAQNALAAFDQGRQRKQQDEARNAFATYAANPNEASLNALAPHNPQFVMQQRATLQKQQQDAQKQHQEQIGLIGRLLSNVRDEGSYQQALAAARQGGIDLTDVPPNFDPNWVSNTKMLVDAFTKDGGQQISGLARELQDAGYQPGTPGFTKAMKVALQGKYAPQYTDAQGNLRQGSLPEC